MLKISSTSLKHLGYLKIMYGHNADIFLELFLTKVSINFFITQSYYF
jgi:tRNA(Ile)-lysidine synthase TilS/MesJ